MGKNRGREMKPLNSILYVVEDPSTEPAAAVARAVSLAENNQARLTVCHVAERPRLGPFADSIALDDVLAELRDQAAAQLQALLQAAGAGEEVAVEVRFGIAFIEVVRHVLRNQHDLVIKVVGKGGTHSFLFGGIDQHLLRKCPCPVWIMVGDTSANYRKILAAVDFDPWSENDAESIAEDSLNRQILGLAASLATSDFAQLHLVHAWQSITDNVIRVFSSDMPDDEAAANRARERREHQFRLELLEKKIKEQLGDEAYRYLSPRFRLREGNPRDVIPELATELDADLVVMGTVGRTGIPGLLIGNTAEVILNNLECSVLAVKPEGFITPVTLD
jgi:nucleotide-binding universal stress UspA family protein